MRKEKWEGRETIKREKKRRNGNQPMRERENGGKKKGHFNKEA